MPKLIIDFSVVEQLTKAQIQMLKYFADKRTFEGSYRELSRAVHGKPTLASNTRMCVKSLEAMGALMVCTNDECIWSDTNRTFIQINPEWIK